MTPSLWNWLFIGLFPFSCLYGWWAARSRWPRLMLTIGVAFLTVLTCYRLLVAP